VTFVQISREVVKLFIGLVAGFALNLRQFEQFQLLIDGLEIARNLDAMGS